METDNYKTIAAACIAYNHTLVAQSPIDVNLAKQLNILLTDMDFPQERIVMDPLTGALGYGLEYTYSVMERIRLAALGGDGMLDSPLVCLVGEEAWKVKEVKLTAEEEPLWGEQRSRGINWEVGTAMSVLLAGADVVALRHPESLARVRTQLDDWFGTEAKA